jgi:hypothetical protein
MKKLLTILTLALAGILLACVAVIGCARAASIKLAWNANPAADGVTEYCVWRGIECLATVSGTEAVVTVPDGPCVLTVTARNAAGLVSPHSEPLRLVSVKVQESTDLKTWKTVGTIHRERKPAAFYRLEVQP